VSLKREDITVQEGLKIFDAPGRELAKKVLPNVLSEIEEVRDHPNEYSIDLIGFSKEGESVAYIEVEASHSWKTGLFPWKKLSYLEERKGRYLYEARYQDLNMYFVMFNRDFSAFALTDRKSILESPVETHTRTWKGEEKFRMIGRNKFNVFWVEECL